MKNEIIIFENQNVKLEVNMKDETVWLTQNQIALLFDRDVKTISKHIINVFSEELEEERNSQKMRIPNSDKPVNFYNLDVIISIGYRVKSQNGIIFRRWANNILKEYMIKGYSINQKRLEYLEKTVKLIDIASRIDENLQNDDAKQILKAINKYSKALNLLDDYDHKTLEKKKGNNSDIKIDYNECINVINKLKFNEESNLFALERNNGLKSIIEDIYQTFDSKDVYESIEEKASNFLYMIVKNHVFIDGNKRIAATLFIYFLQFYNILYKDNIQIIDNNTLTALTLLIAESNPREKDIIINLVMNFLIN
ncbi:MAG: virulence protein RhuM/Fic/DOC family protein [Bacilli bacterium]|nr:virulence protein RhuM/Fic/DOC family protein [Bacilli bacterium]